MENTQEMHSELFTALRKNISLAVHGDMRRLKTLTWAVLGLCSSKSANISDWTEVVISRARYAASRERRFQRWLHNEHITPDTFYPPLLKAALADWDQDQRAYVALDTSVLSNGYVLIRTALIYRGRALPVAWRVIKHSSATVSYEDYSPVLEQTKKALPEKLEIVLLADRGFLHRPLIVFAHKADWHYRLRAKASTLVRLNKHREVRMSELRPPQEHAHFYHDVQVLDEDVHLALATPVPEKKDDEVDPWYVVSDERTGETTLDEFALRFDIEENFLDDKSNGFQVESSKLDDALAIGRLFLVLAVATLHFTSVGVGVVKAKLRRWVDSHWRRGKSYLKIGWDWLRQQYRQGWPTFTPFWIDPAPDPQPAVASLRQANQDEQQWVVSCFGFP